MSTPSRFKKDKEIVAEYESQVKVLHLGKRNQMHCSKMGNTWLNKTSSEKDFGIVVDRKLNMNQQFDVAAKSTALIERSILNHEVLVPLYSALVRPHLEYYAQTWTPHFKKDADKLERVQRRVTRMIQGLETKPY
ncbi:SLIT-ROBO Rho GTPase-activating protein 1 [Varanus komodoensis]|nr:SLIT-ROBO Rho GTPase-activating protein 1 [Varanus komodoensis]